MNYEEKLKIANEYLNKICGLDWEDLPDINSLHNAYDKEEIIELCEERLSKDDYFDSDLFNSEKE